LGYNVNSSLEITKLEIKKVWSDNNPHKCDSFGSGQDRS